MAAGAVASWRVGLSTPAPAPTEGVVAFDAEQLVSARASAALALGFHEAVAASVPPASHVDIHLPGYRSRTLVPVLSWLVASRLALPGGTAAWHVGKQQGPESLLRLLEGLGWTLESSRKGREVALHGSPPATADLPEPRSFTAVLGDHQVRLYADYGVFSPEHIDAGTELLLRVAMREREVDTVADIGTGYGPLAIGLLLNGVARSAIATDVDCLALWLTGKNADVNNVSLDLACTPDPTSVPPTALTVCAIPTHINRQATERLMRGLAERARQGRLLAAVHASLEARYTEHLLAGGLSVERHHGAAHVVLKASKAARRHARRLAAHERPVSAGPARAPYYRGDRRP